MTDQRKQSLSLCHTGLVKHHDHRGHLVNQLRLLLFDKHLKQQLKIVRLRMHCEGWRCFKQQQLNYRLTYWCCSRRVLLPYRKMISSKVIPVGSTRYEPAADHCTAPSQLRRHPDS